MTILKPADQLLCVPEIGKYPHVFNIQAKEIILEVLSETGILELIFIPTYVHHFVCGTYGPMKPLHLVQAWQPATARVITRMYAIPMGIHPCVSIAALALQSGERYRDPRASGQFPREPYRRLKGRRHRVSSRVRQSVLSRNGKPKRALCTQQG